MSSMLRYWVRLTAIAVLCLFVFGCGGGGGGGGSAGTGSFTYFVNFGTSAQGQSVVATLTDPSGHVVGTQVLNASASSGSTPVQATFDGLQNETLYLKASLYSGAKGSGSVMGVSQTAIYGTSANPVTSDVGATATAVSVSPTSPSIAVGKTISLVAEATDASGNSVFEPSAPTWSVTAGGSYASVSSAGLVSGTAQGTATVQAAFGTLTGTTSINVTSTNTGVWTIMLFLNAANDLDIEAPLNISQIEQIAQTPTSQTRFVIQYKLSSQNGSDIPAHPFNGTRRFLAVNGNLQLIQDLGQGVDMGSYATLGQFVQWSMQNYPAQHYALIMWDHGNGYRAIKPNTPPKWRGISYDEDTGNHIDVWQFAYPAGSQYPYSLASVLNGKKLDIISFDACLMQMIEVQDELAGYFHYMVCPEDNQPGPGYPYNLSFGNFFTDPQASVPSLCEGIATGFFNGYKNDPDYNTSPLSQSVVDLTQVPGVVSALNTFSQSIVSAGSSVGSTVSAVRQASQPYDAPDGYYFYDLGSISSRFASSATASSAVQSAASKLQAAEQAAVVYSQHNSYSPDSTGISIEFGNNTEFSQYASTYQNLAIASQTSWYNVLDSAALNPAP